MIRTAAFVTTLLTLVGDRLDNRKDRGATAVEYGLMVGLIAVAIIGAVTLLGDQLGNLFESIKSSLEIGDAEVATAG